MLNGRRDIRFRKYERLAGNFHDPFIRAAGCRGWKLRRRVCDVRTDDGEVAGVEFPNIRAAVAARCFRSVRVRVGADPFQECNIHNAPISEQINSRIPLLSSSVFGALRK